MLAVAKTPRTDLRIEGYIPESLLIILKKVYGRSLRVKEAESATKMVDVFSTKAFKTFKKKVHSGDYVKCYRENLGLTQVALGEKVGRSRAYICDIEKGRRAMSKEMALKLSKLFKMDVSVFIA